MRIGRNEIIEELTKHMRRFGGEPSEWCVGMAPTIAKLQTSDSGANPDPPELAYREAHTPYAAAETVEYLVSAFGLHPVGDSRPGNIVYVYHAALSAARG